MARWIAVCRRAMAMGTITMKMSLRIMSREMMIHMGIGDAGTDKASHDSFQCVVWLFCF